MYKLENMGQAPLKPVCAVLKSITWQENTVTEPSHYGLKSAT